MIVKHKNLPEISELEKCLYAQAILYIILIDNIEERYIKKLESKNEQESVFLFDDYSSDGMLIVFSSNACIILGFDHEFCDFKKHPELYGELPSSLYDLLNQAENAGHNREEDFMFCVWRESISSDWYKKSIHDNVGEEYDADEYTDFSNLISNIYSSAEDFIENAWFKRCKGLPLSGVKQVYAGEKITEKIIGEINPERDVNEVLMEVDKILLEKR